MFANGYILYVKSIFYYFKIFGVATIIYHTSPFKINKKQSTLFSCSTSGLLYNIFLISLITISCYFCFVFAYFHDFAGRTAFERATDSVQTAYAFFACVFILIIYIIRQGQVLSLANKLCTAYAFSTIFNENEQVESALKDVKSVLIANAISTTFWIVTTPTYDTDLFIYCIGVTLCNLVINAMMIQYCVLLKLILHIFRVINTNLGELAKEPSSVLDICLIQNDKLKLKNFLQIRELYAMLCQISLDLSDFYSPQMLVSLLHIFLTFLIYSYYVIKAIVLRGNGLTLLVIFHCMGQVLLYALSLTILTRSSTATVNESRKTGVIVNECCGYSSNRHMEHQLNQFSNYLLHKNINFTVFNLFTLDESLLMSVAGSITTYLIILFQYRN